MSKTATKKSAKNTEPKEPAISEALNPNVDGEGEALKPTKGKGKGSKAEQTVEPKEEVKPLPFTVSTLTDRQFEAKGQGGKLDFRICLMRPTATELRHSNPYWFCQHKPSGSNEVKTHFIDANTNSLQDAVRVVLSERDYSKVFEGDVMEELVKQHRVADTLRDGLNQIPKSGKGK
jgi:hypothetical protein